MELRERGLADLHRHSARACARCGAAPFRRALGRRSARPGRIRPLAAAGCADEASRAAVTVNGARALISNLADGRGDSHRLRADRGSAELWGKRTCGIGLHARVGIAAELDRHVVRRDAHEVRAPTVRVGSTGRQPHGRPAVNGATVGRGARCAAGRTAGRATRRAARRATRRIARRATRPSRIFRGVVLKRVRRRAPGR